MSFLQWNESLSVGVKHIDQQHMHLISLINKLHDAMLKGQANAELGKVLDELVRYTHSHFSSEERLFAEHKYPDTPAHLKEHAAFTKEVSEFQEKFKKGSVVLSLQVMQFLKDWLVKHIKGTDQKYSSFFASRNIQ